MSQEPVDFQGQRSNNKVTMSQDRSNGCGGVRSISIISQYMQSYWCSKQSNINIIYNISVITITIKMTIILANFGKYAISDCTFITCQNFQFWQVCSFDRLFVCVFVYLSVRNFFDTGHSFQYIVTKLGPSMYLCHVTMPIVFLGQRLNK